ncbi:hypothetical protein [Enterococcus sp. CSURQ0835]|uniref:hypothetical protein n=1 Tax=Enterococcus sp. CSURQ0835 TaxID=2681394 RepID=UPI0013585D36|nr:hypothetical protein [Enterococcus sp. CSURQ0835]
MPNFQQDYPYFAKTLKQKFPNKAPLNSFWHWALLGIFGLLTFATVKEQFLLIGLLIAATALVKGPGMILWGAAYSFLVSLFPPLGIVLSAVFFLLNIRLLTKSWRVNLAASWFYLYPFAMSAVKYFTHWNAPWQTALLLLPGLLILHFTLAKLYQLYPVARQVAWTILAIPFELLAALLPKRFKNKFKQMPEEVRYRKTYRKNPRQY